MTGAAVYLLLGLSLLLAIVLPQVTRRIALSPPMVLVARRHGARPAAARRRGQPRPAGPPRPRHARHRVHACWSRSWASAWPSTAPSTCGRGARGAPGHRCGGCCCVTMPLTILGVGRPRLVGRRPGAGGRAAPRRRARADRPGARLRRAGRRAAHRGHRRAEDEDDEEPGRGRRHPLLPHRGGRAQRRAGLPVRAPRPAPAGRRVRARGRRPRGSGWYVVGKIVARRRGRHRRRLAAGPPGLPRPQRQAAPGRPRRAPARAGRAAGGVRRRGARRRLRLPRGLRLRDAAARRPSAATPTSGRCTASSSGSSG